MGHGVGFGCRRCCMATAITAISRLLYRVLALLVLSAVAGWVASLTERGGAFWHAGEGVAHRDSQGGVADAPRNHADHTHRVCVCDYHGLILWGLDSVLGWLASLIDLG
jgi:preprotein translocase subunit SecE